MRKHISRHCACVCGLSSALAAGCANDGPTFSEDVAPILQKNCVTCHQADGIAPFALTDYDAAKSHSRAIATATRARKMPPMPVNNDGSCNHYANARWLSDDEIDTLGAWADDGAPEGSGSPSITPPPAATLDDPDVVLELGRDYVPNDALDDDYRCFVLPAPVVERAFMTRYELVPGDARVVHHAILFQPDSEDAAAEAHARDEAESGDGYTCFGGPGVSASPVALWAPGAGVVAMPVGTGVALEANRDVVLQIHYNLEHGTYPDRTRLKLDVVPSGVTPGVFSPVANLEMMLPPRRDYVETTGNVALLPHQSFVVHGAMPHMHTLGRTLRVEGEVGGETRCLVDVDRWDFHWQNAWWYDAPLALEDVSSISIRCGYDTSSRSDVTAWGEGTSDEMCISYFYLTTRSEQAFSCEDAENPLFGSCIDTFFDGCFTPETEAAACTRDGGDIEWPDGSRYSNHAGKLGLYRPGDDTPCIVGTAEAGTMVLERGDERISYELTEQGVRFTCADGSSFETTPFQLNEFGICQGLACPPR